MDISLIFLIFELEDILWLVFTCSNSTMERAKQRRRSGVFIGNFEQI